MEGLIALKKTTAFSSDEAQAEKEVTKLLQMVQAICEQMGLKHIAEDKEVEEFSQETSVETLAQRLEDTLPEA